MLRPILLAVLLSISTYSSAQEVIRPRVAPAFGKVILVKATFVEKPNDYYSQNIIRAPYVLRVAAVNGKELKEAVLIEYVLDLTQEERLHLEELGRVNEFDAYETVYQQGVPAGWTGGIEQFYFSFRHKLHVKPVGKGTPTAEPK